MARELRDDPKTREPHCRQIKSAIRQVEMKTEGDRSGVCAVA
jgi:hypothetical protein